MSPASVEFVALDDETSDAVVPFSVRDNWAVTAKAPGVRPKHWAIASAGMKAWSVVVLGVIPSDM